ncbi:DUF6233 domain-containing protein [Streptomyces sp. NPDC001340]
MNDPALSHLDLLRFLERVQEGDLARTRRWIADEERKEQERQTGEAARLAPPDWLLEYGLNRDAMPNAVPSAAATWRGNDRRAWTATPSGGRWRPG